MPGSSLEPCSRHGLRCGLYTGSLELHEKLVLTSGDLRVPPWQPFPAAFLREGT